MRARRSVQPGAKVQALYQEIRALAYQAGPGTQLPTMRILSEQFATTRATLSDALDLLEAEHILYRKEREGIFVSPEIFHKVIFILFDMTFFTDSTISPFWSILLVRLEQEAQKRSAVLRETSFMRLVRPLQDQMNSLPPEIRTLLEVERVDGVLSIGINTKEKDWQWPVPCVTFAAAGDWVVELDALLFGQSSAQILLNKGCTRPGFWTYPNPSYRVSPQELPVADEMPMTRLQEQKEFCGFTQVLQEHRLPLQAELYRESYQPPFQKTLSLQEQGYLLARDVFGLPARSRPDGLVITNDMMADGALVALDELGIRPGQDLHIVTHTNAGSPVLFGRTKHITVLEYDPNQVVLEMFAMLDKLMANQPPASNSTRIAPRQR